MAKIEITFKGETKEVTFTEPQAKIVKKLLEGKKVTYIHSSRREGGDFVWYKESFDSGVFFWHETVGYKAFNGAIRRIISAFGKDSDIEWSRSFEKQFWAEKTY